MEEINKILEKYNNFRYEQLRFIEQCADGSKIVTLVVVDEDGEDEFSFKIEFTNVNSSKLIINSALQYLDMSSGITLIQEHGLYGFAIGSGSAMSHVQNAPVFIISSEIKILEAIEL
ncbi:MAG: hypothetical protein U9N39_00315 [Campylobacterota bacterium]|nr:hypothetical protein [Campylobacterota bacterium]